MTCNLTLSTRRNPSPMSRGIARMVRAPMHTLVRIMATAAIGLMATTLHASAQGMYFWQDDGWDDAPPPVVRERPPPRPRLHRHPKVATINPEGRKPQGPLVIAISLDRQRLKLYDANGVFAESPISTGMRGHGTPMGVFSVIQKQKWHRSNIYSGAPMPYMQRITWSGIALHAGVVPGYPASHGCIRMPANFATRMYGWTRMGARVIITPGDITPTSIAHSLLPTEKPKPTTAALTPPQANTDKGADVNSAAVVPHDPIRTADASGSIPDLTKPPISPVSDHDDAGQIFTADKLDLRSALDASTDTTAPPSAVDDKAASDETKPDEANAAETKSSDEPVAAKARADSNETIIADANKSDTTATPDATTGTATVGVAKDKSPAAPVESSPIKDNEPAAPGTRADGATAKDASRAASPDKPDTPPAVTAAKPAPKRSGRIAVFISGKDSKIYVRQNFAPLFDAPITIAASDRPLGTHIFTAAADTADKDHFHWSVVSLPAMRRHAERPQDRHHRHGKFVADDAMISAPQADTASEALDRITIPDNVMSQIAESLSTGGSIIVSDLGVKAGGETGEGTDFIVPLR